MSKAIKKYWRRETIAFFILGCAVIGVAVLFLSDGIASAGKAKLDKLTLSCDSSTPTSITLRVTAGTTGAPAGFSIQWMKLSDFVAKGSVWPSDSDCPLDINGNPTCPTSFCKASLSGVPGCSNYNLGPGQSITVQIGDNLFDDCGASSTCASDPLECNTQYIFRAFAHNVPGPGGLARSDFSANQVCSTAPCGGGDHNCTFTQGYWKTHGPVGCVEGNNTNQWPVTSLMLGDRLYSATELCSILNQPAGGNGLLTLAHQLIAAKFNIAAGADGSSVAAAIAAADALIGSNVIPPVGNDTLSPASVSSLVNTLTSFNEGTTGPGHCQ